MLPLLFRRNIRIKKKQMFSRIKFAALLLPLLSALACAQAAPENASVHAGDQTAAPAVVNSDAPDASAKPPAGPTGQSTVQFEDRLLTIRSRQTRLGDLLAAISEKTGVTFDLPDSLADRPVTAEAGPAALRDALTALLKKLEVGYGISGDPAQPDIVERVVLTAVSEAGPAPAGDNVKASAANEPEEQTDDGMTPYEVEEMLAKKGIQQNLAIEKKLAEAEAERQAQIAKEDFGGKPPEPDKISAPRRRAKKNSTPPQSQ